MPPPSRVTSDRSGMPRSFRLAAGLAGGSLACVGLAGLRDPLASMADYTVALMVLNQAAPPLLLLALRRRVDWVLFDPVLAVTAFVALSVGVSLPGLLDPTLANALYAAPLGALELLAGLMIWAQAFAATQQCRPGWPAALLLWLASLPMTAVAVVWMLADHVLYTPYLDVVCRWDIPPLADQRWAGLAMFVAGIPMQLAAAAVLLVPPSIVPADRSERQVALVATGEREDARAITEQAGGPL